MRLIGRPQFGSLERFTGILFEQYSGLFPLWLAPQQAAVLTISEGQNDYAHQVLASLKRASLRAAADLRNEKVGYKICEHTLQKVPYQLVIGEQEKAQGLVTLRSRAGDNLGSLTPSEPLERLHTEARMPAQEPPC